MTRTAAFLAVMLALLAACTTASAHTPLAYTPLTSGFQRLGVPGWSGRPPVQGAATAGALSPSLSTPSQSTSQPVPGAPGATNSPKPLYRPRPTATPVVGGIGDTAGALKGQSTWYNDGPGLYGAAGPKLRALIPGYLHRYVTVCARGVCVRVRLITSCACQPDTRLIDLSLDAFSRLAAPSVGILEVTVSW